jgi:hypothetical protein
VFRSKLFAPSKPQYRNLRDRNLRDAFAYYHAHLHEKVHRNQSLSQSHRYQSLSQSHYLYMESQPFAYLKDAQSTQMHAPWVKLFGNKQISG